MKNNKFKFICPNCGEIPYSSLDWGSTSYGATVVICKICGYREALE